MRAWGNKIMSSLPIAINSIIGTLWLPRQALTLDGYSLSMCGELHAAENLKLAPPPAIFRVVAVLANHQLVHSFLGSVA